MRQEFKEYISIRHLDDLEALNALFYRHTFGRHFHEGYAIGMIINGSETYECNQKTIVAPRGSIIIVNPGEIHNGHASDVEDGWRYFMIYPQLSLIQKTLRQMDLDTERLPWFKENAVFDPQLKRRFELFMAALAGQDTRLSLETHFICLLHELIDRHADFNIPDADRVPDHPAVKNVVEKIHDLYHETLSLESLAWDVDLSVYALLRLFKKQIGVSPYLLQTGLRIKHAKKLLKTGASLAESAAECGFTDQSHMTRQFRRWIGITPGDYGKALSKV